MLLFRECHRGAKQPDKLAEALSDQSRKAERIQITFSGGKRSSSAPIRRIAL